MKHPYTSKSISILKEISGFKTDESFGNAIGKTKQEVGMWRNGKVSISFDYLCLICVKLGLDIDIALRMVFVA